ncbi:hypothetical protein R1sor_003504 [Riccia sorocarpa]|uniref:DNA-directed RNA polymerase I subunit RPA43 n=1 Tax=Riccia sorocarpa TaxID=122646 RepID=A0ABD3H4I7_9MARC
MEGLAVVHANIGVFVHPSRAANVKQGVHEILNSLLLKYNEEFDGVVLAYLKSKILDKSARILAGLTPYFHVNLTAKLLIFSPSPGMLIEGKVNKVEKDYIGVVVLGLFNAAIGVSDIREDLYYNESPNGREWVSESDERHSVKLGSIIRFSVKRSANDGGRKHKIPNKVKEDDSLLVSAELHDAGKVQDATQKDVRISNGTPHSDGSGRKHKKETDEIHTPDEFRPKKKKKKEFVDA